MEIKGTWSAKSNLQKNGKNSLKELVGQIGVTVDVRITNPYKYSKASIYDEL